MDYDLIASEETEISEIRIQDFEGIIGGSLEAVLSQNEKSHEKKMTALAGQIGHPANSVKLEDLIFIKKLGICSQLNYFKLVFKVLGNSDLCIW